MPQNHGYPLRRGDTSNYACRLRFLPPPLQLCELKARKPLSYRRGDGLEVCLEVVVAGDLRHLANWARWRHPEPVALALDDEGRHRYGVELGETALRRLAAARRLERDARQSTATAPVSSTVRQATRAPIERPPTMSGRPASSRSRSCSTTATQAVFSCGAGPGSVGRLRVRAARSGRRTSPPIGRVARRHEIRCLDAAGGAVAEDESRAWLIGAVQVGTRWTVRGVVARSWIV